MIGRSEVRTCVARCRLLEKNNNVVGWVCRDNVGEREEVGPFVSGFVASRKATTISPSSRVCVSVCHQNSLFVRSVWYTLYRAAVAPFAHSNFTPLQLRHRGAELRRFWIASLRSAPVLHIHNFTHKLEINHIHNIVMLTAYCGYGGLRLNACPKVRAYSLRNLRAVRHCLRRVRYLFFEVCVCVFHTSCPVLVSAEFAFATSSGVDSQVENW